MKLKLLLALGLLLITSGCIDSNPENSATSTFDSETDFIDYMENTDQSTYSSRNTPEDQHVSGDKAADTEVAETDTSNQVRSAKWIQATENRILISNRYPRHFQSVKIPELDLEHNISEAGGPTVIHENNTIIHEEDRIVAYNQEMEEEWDLGLESYLKEVKVSGDKAILLTRETEAECPINPMHGVDIACSSVIRPIYTAQNDYTYTLTTLNASTGEEINSESFVASSRTEVEVTPEKTFISYSDRKAEHEIMTDFLLNEESVSSETLQRVQELQEYDLTDRSMRIELEAAVRKNEDMESLEEEFNKYDQENFREYEESTLLIVDNENLSIEERKFDGRISRIDSEDKTLLTIDFNGEDYDNRETKIRLLEGTSKNIEGNAQLFNEKILVKDQETLYTLDEEMNEINSVELEAFNVETAENKILVSQRVDEKSKLILYNSNLEKLDSRDIDSRMIYYLDLVKGKDKAYALTNNYESNQLLNISDEIKMYETEASGQLVYADGLYAVGDTVQKLSADGEIKDELDLETPRIVRPLEEHAKETN